MINSIIIKYLLFSFCLLPLGLAFGPAIPDIIISLGGILFLIYLYLSKNIDFLKKNYFLAFLIVCLYLVFTSLISSNIALSLESTLFYFRFGVMVLVIVFLSQNTNFLKYFTITLLITLVTISLDTFIEFFSNESLLYYLFFGQSNMLFKDCLECANYSGRISGIFGEEFILGSYLVRLLPILVGLLFFNFSSIKYFNYLILFLLILVSSAIFLSGERTAFFMLILFILISFIMVKRIRKIIFFSGLISSLIIMINISTNHELKTRMVNYTIKQFYQTTIKDNEDNLVELENKRISFFSVQHEVIYLTSLKIYRDSNYLFGIGPKIFREKCLDIKYHSYTIKDGSVNGCQLHPHNTYVQILLETGLIGFLLIFSIFIFLNVKFVKIYFYKKNKYIEKYFLLNLFCIINIYINLWPLMPTGNFFHNWISLIYFIPIGFYFYSKNLITNHQLDDRQL